jgi:hypothetical protein
VQRRPCQASQGLALVAVLAGDAERGAQGSGYASGYRPDQQEVLSQADGAAERGSEQLDQVSDH